MINVLINILFVPLCLHDCMVSNGFMHVQTYIVSLKALQIMLSTYTSSPLCGTARNSPSPPPPSPSPRYVLPFVFLRLSLFMLLPVAIALYIIIKAEYVDN